MVCKYEGLYFVLYFWSVFIQSVIKAHTKHFLLIMLNHDLFEQNHNLSFINKWYMISIIFGNMTCSSLFESDNINYYYNSGAWYIGNLAFIITYAPLAPRTIWNNMDLSAFRAFSISITRGWIKFCY